MSIIEDAVGLRFGEPLALAALVAPLLAVAALLFARNRRYRAATLLGGAPALRGGASEGRRLVMGVLLVVAMALAVFAAARPQWGTGEQALEQRGIDLVIALDVSRSMEAQDIAPSRAEAAAAGLGDMLTHLTGNRVGLVTFAGSAFVRAPLTVDLPVLSSMVTRAQSEAPLVQPGTDLAAAIRESLEVLDVDDPARTQAILLVSDGEDLQPEIDEAILEASARGVRVYTVFAATSQPTPLSPLDDEADLTTGRPDLLEEIARATGGRSRGPEQIAGFAVEFRRLQQTQFAADSERALIERFPWFVGGAVALLAMALLVGEGGRRPRPRLRGGAITAALTVVAVLLAACGTAAWRHVEEGNAAFEEQRYEDALEAYRQAADAVPDEARIDYDTANALHALRRFEEAGVAADEAIAQALEDEDASLAALAHYTRANTAFRREQWEVARDAYMAALRINPNDREAKANLELVLAVLEPPPPPPPQEEPDDQDPDDGEPDQGGEGDQGGEEPAPNGEPQEPGQPQGQGGPQGQPTPGQGQPGGEPAGPGEEGGEPGGEPAGSLEEAQAALAEALGELGSEVTPEQALRILELARRANELQALPGDPRGGPTPR